MVRLMGELDENLDRRGTRQFGISSDHLTGISETRAVSDEWRCEQQYRPPFASLDRISGASAWTSTLRLMPQADVAHSMSVRVRRVDRCTTARITLRGYRAIVVAYRTVGGTAVIYLWRAIIARCRATTRRSSARPQSLAATAHHAVARSVAIRRQRTATAAYHALTGSIAIGRQGLATAAYHTFAGSVALVRQHLATAGHHTLTGGVAICG